MQNLSLKLRDQKAKFSLRFRPEDPENGMVWKKHAGKLPKDTR